MITVSGAIIGQRRRGGGEASKNYKKHKIVSPRNEEAKGKETGGACDPREKMRAELSSL